VGTTSVGQESEAPDDLFERFYRAQFTRLARLAWLLTGEAATSEDLAQEALARTQVAFEQLDTPAAYARTVLVNLCRGHRRRAARQRVVEANITISGESHAPQPRELLDAVAALPYRQRVLIVLRYYDDASERDIASALGCRPGTVKSLATRALTKLRSEIDRG
jgi:RNA polymerase sigma-70 factor (sigma-E family)